MRKSAASVCEICWTISADLPVKAKMGVVGEPTSMRLVVEHKGKVAYRVEVRGLEGHSSNPRPA